MKIIFNIGGCGEAVYCNKTVQFSNILTNANHQYFFKKIEDLFIPEILKRLRIAAHDLTKGNLWEDDCYQIMLLHLNKMNQEIDKHKRNERVSPAYIEWACRLRAISFLKKGKSLDKYKRNWTRLQVVDELSDENYENNSDAIVLKSNQKPAYEIRFLIDDCLSCLSEKERPIFDLLSSDYNVTEIAKNFDVSQQSISDAMYSIRKKLRPLFNISNRKFISKTESRKIPVRCKETGVIYKSATDAADYINGTRSGICNVAIGRRKTYKGLTWEYINPNMKSNIK